MPDVEFGFLDERLRLFQLRPFLDSAYAQGNSYLQRMDQGSGRRNSLVDMLPDTRPVRWILVGLVLHLLIALIWLPITLQKQLQLNHFVKQEAPAAFADFPEMSVYAGELRTDVQAPRPWNDPESDLPFLLVDPTGEITSLEGRPERVLVTQGTSAAMLLVFGLFAPHAHAAWSDHAESEQSHRR